MNYCHLKIIDKKFTINIWYIKFISYLCSIKHNGKNMSKDLSNNELHLDRKQRKDIGSEHSKPKYGDIVLRKYKLNGEFVAEYTSIQDAVKESDGKLKYNGIYMCIHGKQRSYGGFLWRSDAGTGTGKLMIEK